MNHLLVIACWTYAAFQIYFHPQNKLACLGFLLMSLGFSLLLRPDGFRSAWRTWTGRIGVLIVAGAWVVIGAGHVFRR